MECPLRKPISIGMYSSKALTWPHAFGYLSFEITMPAEGAGNQSILEVK